MYFPHGHSLPILAAILLLCLAGDSQAHCDRCSNQTSAAPASVGRRRAFVPQDVSSSSGSSSAGAAVSLGKLAELHAQHQRLLETLETRLERIERDQLDRTASLDTQIRQILQRQSESDRNANDNRRLMLEIRDNREQPPADGSSSVASKLESLAYLLQSTRRAVHNLNATVTDALLRLAEQIRDLPNDIDTAVNRRITFDESSAAVFPALLAERPVAQSPPIGCESIGRNASNVYVIRASSDSPTPFYAYCSMAEPRAEPAWTVVLSRSDAQTSFQRSWSEYRDGFGNVAGDHWLGLQRLHQLTAGRLHELRIELQDHQGQFRYASYAAFAVGDESQAFALRVLGAYAGTAGDAFGYHAGQKFSTVDADNDAWSEGNCAQAHSGAGWYRACDKTNLMGRYLPANASATPNQGIYWDTFHGPNYSLKSVLMMIRALH